MLKPSCRPLQTSSHLFLRPLTSAPYLWRRSLVTAAVRASEAPRAHDDSLLRNVFDSASFWQSFRHSQCTISSLPNGLLGNRYLTNPKGFITFSQETTEKCRRLVARVVESSTAEDRRLIPKLLDRLSDSLCRVLDVADFVRATHPDSEFQQASSQAYAMLYEFMNVLNTTPDLKVKLEAAFSNPSISATWTEEEKMVAHTLLKDFSKSAIESSHENRQAFVELSSQISRLGAQFVRDMKPEKSAVSLRDRQLKGVDPLVLQHTGGRRFMGTSIPTSGPVAFSALRTMRDATARRDLYIAARTAPQSQLQTLRDLLQARAKIANLGEYRSYADLNLTDKLAKTPVAVDAFLGALSRDNESQVQRELGEMLALKKLDAHGADDSTQIEAWDRDFYQNQIADQLRSRSRRPDFISAYFSLGSVMQGLSRLFTRLYGIHFVPVAVSPREVWHPDVRRLDVIDESEGRIAVLYCDLFARPSKSPNPAHFTLRCSRRIDASEIEEASILHPGVDPLQTVNDGMAISHDPRTKTTYQLPTIALICDFEPPSTQSNDHHPPTLLSFRDLQTLFHEMGHAVHSILGRTACQVVSGTRCATDFAELPSVLMEHFAADPTVLALFARHWETGSPLPYEMVAERLAIDRRGQGVETEHQILLAMLDQAYHSDLPLTMPGGFDSTKVLHDVYDRYGSVREPRETSAQGFFGHLVEYGGTYYSYLFDRAIAGKVWQQVFNGGRDGGAISRERGQKFRDEVLKWGGGRDGWTCLAELLGDERLRAGGPEAMAEVGRWGVKD
ncbi:MAG: hypothetical protein Q9219_005189 [cf. Caloplaca sp. 3 TL-2023]